MNYVLFALNLHHTYCIVKTFILKLKEHRLDDDFSCILFEKRKYVI